MGFCYFTRICSTTFLRFSIYTCTIILPSALISLLAPAFALSKKVSALEKANIRTVGGLARKKEQDLMEIEGLGPKSIQEIKRALANFGIVLK